MSSVGFHHSLCLMPSIQNIWSSTDYLSVPFFLFSQQKLLQNCNKNCSNNPEHILHMCMYIPLGVLAVGKDMWPIKKANTDKSQRSGQTYNNSEKQCHVNTKKASSITGTAWHAVRWALPRITSLQLICNKQSVVHVWYLTLFMVKFGAV